MSLVFSGESSVSQAQVIAMSSENKHYVKIQWVYLSNDISGKEHKNLYGEGTTDLALQLIDGKKSLTGTYYSSKLKKGRINLGYKGENSE